MKIALCYVYCVCENYEAQADRFLSSYVRFDPGVEHDLIVIVNDSRMRFPDCRSRFAPAHVQLFQHDDSGWDIGAYRAFAQTKGHEYDAMMCCGGHCHFKRASWLKRFADAWDLLGPGAYGSLATFEVRPHFCTTGFMTSPILLQSYPHAVSTKAERYNFEHGENSFHRMVSGMGFPVRLVTWDGIWTLPQWRTPPNIYRRGDQSNCLTFSQHTERFAVATWERPVMERLANSNPIGEFK